MVGSGSLQSDPLSSKELLPKGTDKDGIPITSDGSRKSMKFKNAILKNRNKGLSCIRMGKRNEVSIFGMSINNYPNDSFSLGFWKPFNEIHGNISLRQRGNRETLYKTRIQQCHSCSSDR